MVQYDPTVIHTFVERLYRQAKSIVVTATVLGVLVGFIGGAALGNMNRDLRDASTMIMIFGVVIGGGLGYAIGQARAFALRLMAQTALCQVQIEENTRRGAAGTVGRVA